MVVVVRYGFTNRTGRNISGPTAPNTGIDTVPKRPFGKTGDKVSILGLGGMFDIPSNQLLLKQSIKWGVTYWDTADCYEGGKSEKGIGMFFEKYPEERKKIFLVTKSDKRTPDGMDSLLNRSLERMKTSYIDLYFIHGLKSINELNGDTKKLAEKAKAEKKIRFFGFSTHSNMEENMVGAARLGWIDGIMMAYNFRLMHSGNMKKALEACVKAGIGLTAMKTQGGGQVNASSETELEMAGRFIKNGYTDKQAKLKAVWEHPDIASVCSQMPSISILMSNIAAAIDKTKLSSVEMDLLKQYAKETACTYCAGCTRICESAVYGAVPIGNLMRCLMYSRNYKEPVMAKELFETIPINERKKIADLDFSIAEQKCPQNLEIGKLVREAYSQLS
ncbi:aldo/keto reductase [Desulfobacterium sp. N47]|uniref:aldo/keto reductase n=1 Tax=Desulfobacterium sp. N47 TaxID=3115210 RepID=UPI003F4A666C